MNELTASGFPDELRPQVEIIQHGTVHMAYLAEQMEKAAGTTCA